MVDCGSEPEACSGLRLGGAVVVGASVWALALALGRRPGCVLWGSASSPTNSNENPAAASLLESKGTTNFAPSCPRPPKPPKLLLLPALLPYSCCSRHLPSSAGPKVSTRTPSALRPAYLCVCVPVPVSFRLSPLRSCIGLPAHASSLSNRRRSVDRTVPFAERLLLLFTRSVRCNSFFFCSCKSSPPLTCLSSKVFLTLTFFSNNNVRQVDS